jgi:beta-galactosidase
LLDIQPQGADFDYFHLVLEFYAALRRGGLNVDVLPPDAPLDGYRLIVVPSLPILDSSLIERLSACNAQVVIGPRTGSKTGDLQIPASMPPGSLQDVMPLRVTRVESLRPGWVEAGDFGVSRWLEHIATELEPLARTASGQGFWYRHDKFQYLGAWPGADLLDAVVKTSAQSAGISVLNLHDDLRIRRRGEIVFVINYGPETVDLSSCVPAAATIQFILGGLLLPPAAVAAWREA